MSYIMSKQFLYVMDFLDAVKVGVSINPARRLRELKNEFACAGARCVAVLEGERYLIARIEGRIKDELAKIRHRYYKSMCAGGCTEFYQYDLKRVINTVFAIGNDICNAIGGITISINDDYAPLIKADYPYRYNINNLIWREKMKVISFWSPKGGIGKSTHTILAAKHYAEKGERVGVIDGDKPQYSIKKYCDYTGDKSFTLHIFDGGSLEKFIDKFCRNYDRVIIDLPPRATGLSRELIATDNVKIIVPVVSGDLDSFSLMELMELHETAKEHGIVDYKLVAFLNRAQPAVGAKTNAETRQLLDDVALTRLKSELVSRTAYGKIASGKTLKELDRKAYNEFCALIDEVDKL
ncbi:hypothetical protein D6S13_24000 [Salmonella enterica subsp. enterica]|nr:hypothetical protein [Salmonella enterica subsp. enterica]